MSEGKAKRSRKEDKAYDDEAYASTASEETPLADEQPAWAERVGERAYMRSEKRRRSAIIKLVGVLLVVVVAIIVLQGTVFRLKTVYVVGNQKCTPQQVTAASGLVQGLNLLAVNEDDVRRSMSSDYSIELLEMRKVYPDTIYLYIREREAVATMQWLGMQYTMDAQGMVMSESNAYDLPENMVVVTGMQVNGMRVGSVAAVKVASQLEAYKSILYELTQQLYLNQISEINLLDLNNLYQITLDGISVRLGTVEHMRAKVGALRTDVAYLREFGKSSGHLDVSIPEDAKFAPD